MCKSTNRPRLLSILNNFLQVNPDHKFAKLYRSVLGVMHDRPEWVTGAIEELPNVDELPPEHIMQVVHVLRFAGNPDAAVDYAYRYLRLHMKSPEAHRAVVLSMSIFEPVPTIQPTLETVEVGAAVRYDEVPSGEPDWIIIEDTDDPVGELKEIPKSSRLAQELLGKKVGDQFVLAPGFMDRKGVIRQIVPKYVRAYNLCGDKWQLNFPRCAVHPVCASWVHRRGNAGEHRSNARGPGKTSWNRSGDAHTVQRCFYAASHLRRVAQYECL
jgi:hypothetical protein